MTTQTGWATTAEFEEEIDISARPGRIYGILDDAKSVPQLIPELNQAQPSGNNSYTAVYTVRVLGLVPLNFTLSYNVEANNYPEEVTLHFHGNVEGVIRWDLASHGDTTHVVAHANYKFSRQVIDDLIKNNMPKDGMLGGLLNRAADITGGMSSQLDLVLESLFTRCREDIKQALRNLKTRSEG
ncbi:hypothetical protein EPA93_39930 [Ktedonosporobacter rubrisoli]|uniref:SRPBCC family protein n=1 Tax=Ktedonosporobacter rubrisoli TaxID=2509675 RepID=A0A4P6K0V1_KTERU|nr:SRPBCC family protein [Ktedonosporobacter rubrisoli]QBD81818.1 hypothetical protein EPA93_39930 [Ktedonosporobacter rubrisoli]